jgi:hypothetical protein
VLGHGRSPETVDKGEGVTKTAGPTSAFFLSYFQFRESSWFVNAPEIDKIFDKLREAENGSIIRLGLPDSEDPVEAIIFEPSAQRPPGYETGIFVSVPSESEKIYYLDPEASREQGKLVLKVFSLRGGNGEQKGATSTVGHDLLSEFDYLRHAPDVKMGGGAIGEQYSKAKGILDIG